jgi:phenylalanyl-tRNA synthetase beta chain
MDLLVNKSKLNYSYESVPKYPAVNRDFALLVKEDILVGDIERIIKQRGGKILESFRLFDVYKGKQIEEGHKSVAYSLIFRAKDHTLGEKEISKAMDKILNGLEYELGITLRK